MTIRSTISAVCAALLAVVVHGAIFHSPIGETLEFGALDVWFGRRGYRPPHADVVLISMDNQSYEYFGLSPLEPWPRELHAELIEKLVSRGVKRIVFDILFLGQQSARGDAALAAALQSTDTVIGAELTEVGDPRFGGIQLQQPEASLRRAARTVALVGLQPVNGTVRHFLRAAESKYGEELPSLAVAAAAGAQPADLPRERDLINFIGPARSIPTHAYHEVFEEADPLPDEFLRGKIVFVGLSLTTGVGAEFKDAFLTPYPERGLTFGVEIHAQAASNLLRGDWIRRASGTLEYSVLSVVCFLLCCVLALVPPLYSVWILVGWGVLWTAVSYGAFCGYVTPHPQFVPGAVLSFIVAPLFFLVQSVTYYLRVRRERQKLFAAFQMYLSPEMAREIARSPAALQLGGQQVVATALFTDIEDFTGISESMTPAEVARMLNAYFTEVMGAIFEERGTLIKFIGDAVYALWGAPVTVPDQERRAYAAAVRILEAVQHFNASQRFPALHTRIGLNTGPMLVGNLGARQRFDFTAIGDAVNLASRVEGLNKYLGTSILVTENTLHGLPERGDLMYCGSFRVSGKDQAVNLYGRFRQALGRAEIESWNNTVGLLREGRHSEALEALERIAASDHRFSRLTGLYMTHLREIESRGELHVWDGTLTLERK